MQLHEAVHMLSFKLVEDSLAQYVVRFMHLFAANEDPEFSVPVVRLARPRCPVDSAC